MIPVQETQPTQQQEPATTKQKKNVSTEILFSLFDYEGSKDHWLFIFSFCDHRGQPHSMQRRKKTPFLFVYSTEK